jgi:hypothetical protein
VLCGEGLIFIFVINNQFNMSTIELNKIKLNLIAWIHQLSDVEIISFLEGLKNSKSKKKDWWDELSKDQKQVILAGLRDAENGKVISSDEFWKKLKNA